MHSSKKGAGAQSPPRLSVVVPLLDEAATVAGLFATLASQTGVDFEVLCVDGGSTDATPALLAGLAATAPFPCRLLRSGRGRAVQMNAGAAAAAGAWLLFLHADSTFPDPAALARGHAALAAAETRNGRGVAGRFRVRFAGGEGRELFRRYLETKARLDRPDCIHGDQGLLLRREFFSALGGFDESLPCLEDDRLAAAVAAAGDWLLLPAEIVTSLRRFETEGFAARQLLNALILNAAAAGWPRFLRSGPALYREQSRTTRLRLSAPLAAAHRLLAEEPVAERRRILRESCRYALDNAWQIPFFCAVLRGRWRGDSVDAVAGRWRTPTFAYRAYPQVVLLAGGLALRLLGGTAALCERFARNDLQNTP